MPRGLGTGGVVCGKPLLAQPLSDGQPIHAEMLRETDLGHPLGVGGDGELSGEIHGLGEPSASVGQFRDQGGGDAERHLENAGGALVHDGSSTEQGAGRRATDQAAQPR